MNINYEGVEIRSISIINRKYILSIVGLNVSVRLSDCLTDLDIKASVVRDSAN